MRALTGCVALLGTAMLLVASPATAHFDSTSRYTYKASSCDSGSRIDPINVVFYTWGTWGRAENQVQAHARWSDAGGSGQYFQDHGICYFMHTQRASAGVSSSRYHIRIRGQHEDPSLGWTATGDAHYEDIVLCDRLPKHAVRENGPTGSGFDWGRNELSNAMGMGGHSYYYTWWGNTQNFRQCDGEYARSDGATSFIQLHQVNH
jgi:hypothetical protein